MREKIQKAREIKPIHSIREAKTVIMDVLFEVVSNVWSGHSINLYDWTNVENTDDDAIDILGGHDAIVLYRYKNEGNETNHLKMVFTVLLKSRVNEMIGNSIVKDLKFTLNNRLISRIIQFGEFQDSGDWKTLDNNGFKRMDFFIPFEFKHQQNVTSVKPYVHADIES